MSATPFVRSLCSAAALAGALAAALPPAHAEDIDLYAVGGGKAAAPNVLFFLDNTSNWSAASQAWNKAAVRAKCSGDTTCERYVDTVFGSDTDLKQGLVEVRALKLVINELLCGTGTKLNVNLGIMLISDSGSTESSSWAGGWFPKAIEGYDSPGVCTRLVQVLDDLDANFQSSDYKAPSNASYGAAMFEAFKYFGGYTNPARAGSEVAGTPVAPYAFGPQRYTLRHAREDEAAFIDGTRSTYRSPIDAEAGTCAKNYLVLVGNTWPNQEPLNAAKYDQQLARLGYTGQLKSSTAANLRFADEWANFLATTDVSPAAGQQPLITYAIDVFNAKQDSQQSALLQAMARAAGLDEGGYYRVGGDLKALIDAFKNIFTQISATNSVFASTSLPVSVNAQGTFLNQVFIGMFRPDDKARPRWYGNIKQYQLARNADGNIFLADKDKKPALDNANTGFVDACRSSFWTTDSGTYWSNVPTTQTPLGTCETSPYERTSDLPDGALVEKGGAAQLQRAASPSTRIVKTCSTADCSSLVDLDAASLDTLASAIGVTAPSADLAKWIRGFNTGDGPKTSTGGYETYDTLGSSAARPTIHGDVVHARPLAVNYGSGSTNDIVVYYGAGDGLLRAINGSQTGSAAGAEVWSFFAPEFLGRMNRLRENSPVVAYPSVPASLTPTPQPKDYFFDGSIGAYQARSATGAITAVHLYPTMRRGGRQVYAFDATSRPDPAQPSSMPTFKWKFGCPNLTNDTGCSPQASDLGQTWSLPRVVRLRGDTRRYLVFGAGYDNCEDTNTCTTGSKGRGIYVLDADTGAFAAFIDLASKSGAAGRVVADVVPVDANGDGYADVIYAADTQGNLWRVNISDPRATTPYTGYAPGQWAARTHRIARVADWGGATAAQKRKFMNAPDVLVLGSTAYIAIGTGDREKPLWETAVIGVKNRFYALRDSFNAGASGVEASPDLIDATDCDAAGDVTLSSDCTVLNVTSTSLDYSETMANPAVRGWLIDLAATAEQVVTPALTTGGAVYFSTFQPSDPGAKGQACKRGTARGYAMDFLTGGLRDGDKSRDSVFTTDGMPPPPMAGVVEIDGRKEAIIIGARPPGAGSDIETAGGSTIEARKVLINLLKARKKIYRYQKIDK